MRFVEELGEKRKVQRWARVDMCPNNMSCVTVNDLEFPQITASKLSNVEQSALRG